MWTDNPTLHVNRILEHFAKIDSRYKTVLVSKPGKSPFSDTLLGNLRVAGPKRSVGRPTLLSSWAGVSLDCRPDVS
jgi:hypothetical protein